MTAAEKKAVTLIEKEYLTKKNHDVYIACEEMNFIWTLREVMQFEQLWKGGYSLEYITDQLQRDPDEVALLMIDRARQGMIKPRNSGIH